MKETKTPNFDKMLAMIQAGEIEKARTWWIHRTNLWAALLVSYLIAGLTLGYAMSLL